MFFALIEDEPPARLRMKRLMAELAPGSICLAEADNGLCGLELIRAHGPRVELLFLDVEFPPDGAFGLLQQARSAGLHIPRLAFTTAYEQFAIEAFRWAACDYLLKPIERQRLQETLNRIPPVSQDLGILMQALQAGRERFVPERFTVHSKGRILILNWDAVSHLTTENRLLFVHAPQGKFVLDRSLDELEKLLAPRFVRVHRSAMVAIASVRELVLEAHGTGEVIMADGSCVPVSRERMAALRQLLEQ